MEAVVTNWAVLITLRKGWLLARKSERFGTFVRAFLHFRHPFRDFR